MLTDGAFSIDNHVTGLLGTLLGSDELLSIMEVLLIRDYDGAAKPRTIHTNE